MQNQKCLILSQTYYFLGGGEEMLESTKQEDVMAEAMKNGPPIPQITFFWM